jgi:hypothetical protein
VGWTGEKFTKSIVAAGLAFCVFESSALAGGCNGAAPWKPSYTKKETGSRCRGHRIPTYCEKFLQNLLDEHGKYEKTKARECGSIPRAGATTPDDPNQAESVARAKAVRDRGIGAVGTLIQENQRLREKFGQKGKSLLALYRSDLGKPGTEATLAAKTIHDKVTPAFDSGSGISISPAEFGQPFSKKPPEDSKLKSQAFALKEGAAFLASLVTDEKEFSKAKAELEKTGDDPPPGGPDDPANPPGGDPTTPEGGDKNPKAGGGFDPSSLMSLAGMAAPLAAMFAPKDKPESNISDPLAPLDTSTTPRAASARLDNPTKKTPTSFTLKEDEKKPEDPAASYGGVGQNYGDPYSTDQDSPASSISPSGGGGSMGVSSGGGSGSAPGADSEPEEKARETASLPKTDDLGMLPDNGFGGGGGGGGLMEEMPAEPSEPMKEVLHDMEAALDGETPSWEDGPAMDESQAEAGGVAGENSGTLFTRVSTCISRNLKKGQVLNGLGEKIEEAESK